MTNETSSRHIPVMVNEVVQALRATEGGIFLDCTGGGGGHSKAILDAAPENWLVTVDRDVRAIKRLEQSLGDYADRHEIHHGMFSELATIAGNKQFNGVLADLGLSTDQLFESRGFSFHDDSLDMRMNEDESSPPASILLNEASEQELSKIFLEGGIGSESRKLARSIVSKRPIDSAKQLASIVASSGLGKHSKVHPATVVFQAIRMAVNGERAEIKGLLEAVPTMARPGARFAVITFHSLEDQLVTRTMRGWEQSGTYPAGWRGPREGRCLGRVLTRKALTPTDEEIEVNPSSRSARLRVFEFV